MVASLNILPVIVAETTVPEVRSYLSSPTRIWGSQAPTAPAWNSGTAYVVDNLATSGGLVYRCILANTNQVPPNATYWALYQTKTSMFSLPKLAASIGCGCDIIADGVTDQYSALKTIIESAVSGQTIFLPSGTIRIQINTSITGITVPAGVTIASIGRTRIFVNGGGTTVTCFAMGGAGVNFYNIDFDIVPTASTYNYTVISWGFDTLNVINCTFDGHCVTTGTLGAGSTTTNCKGIVASASADCNGLLIHECAFTRVDEGFDHRNDNTHTHTRITIEDSRFYGNFVADIRLNGQLGVLKDVTVTNCRFHDSAGWQRNATQRGIYAASVTGLIISDNRFYKWTKAEAIRVEEATFTFAIGDNTIEQAGGTGIILQDTNLSGTRNGPRGGSIVGNNCRRTDYGSPAWSGSSVSYTVGNTVTDGGIGYYCTTSYVSSGTPPASDPAHWYSLDGLTYGIQCAFAGPTPEPADRVVIGSNTVYGYYQIFGGVSSRGFEFGSNAGIVGVMNAQAFIAHDNTAENCAIGFWVYELGQGIHDNLSKGCGQGLVGRRAHVASHHCQDCTVNLAAETGLVLVVEELRLTYTKQDASASTITWPVLPAGAANDYDFTTTAHIRESGGSRFTSRYSHSTWDGTTLADTAIRPAKTDGGGTWTSPSLVNSSGLSYSLTTSTSVTGLFISISLRGWIFIKA